MIIFLFKNCAWLQQFHSWKESLKWCIFNKNFLEKTKHSRTLSSSFNYVYISLKRSYRTPVKKSLMRIVLFRSYEHLKLHIILRIFCVLIIFYIYQTIHSFPNKFKSLPSKFHKFFCYNNEDKTTSSFFFAA